MNVNADVSKAKKGNPLKLENRLMWVGFASMMVVSVAALLPLAVIGSLVFLFG